MKNWLNGGAPIEFRKMRATEKSKPAMAYRLENSIREQLLKIIWVAIVRDDPMCS